MEETKCVEPSTLKDGDVVYYFNLDNKGNSFVDNGGVRGENPYKDGVTVYRDGWKQYVSKWFISRVEREGGIIFEQ